MFSTRAVLAKLQQSILANNPSQHQNSENKREITFIDWLIDDVNLTTKNFQMEICFSNLS